MKKNFFWWTFKLFSFVFAELLKAYRLISRCSLEFLQTSRNTKKWFADDHQWEKLKIKVCWIDTTFYFIFCVLFQFFVLSFLFYLVAKKRYHVQQSNFYKTSTFWKLLYGTYVSFYAIVRLILRISHSVPIESTGRSYTYIISYVLKCFAFYVKKMHSFWGNEINVWFSQIDRCIKQHLHYFSNQQNKIYFLW